MAIEVKAVTPRAGYIEAILEGTATVDPHHYYTFLDVLVTACRDHRCSHVLIDRAAVVGTTPTVLQQAIGEHIVRAFPRGTRIALVAPESVSVHRFEATVAGRGQTLHIFWDRDEALEWLLKKRTPIT